MCAASRKSVTGEVAETMPARAGKSARAGVPARAGELQGLLSALDNLMPDLGHYVYPSGDKMIVTASRAEAARAAASGQRVMLRLDYPSVQRLAFLAGIGAADEEIEVSVQEIGGKIVEIRRAAGYAATIFYDAELQPMRVTVTATLSGPLGQYTETVTIDRNDRKWARPSDMVTLAHTRLFRRLIGNHVGGTMRPVSFTEDELEQATVSSPAALLRYAASLGFSVSDLLAVAGVNAVNEIPPARLPEIAKMLKKHARREYAET